jgi:hypothetical protein
MRTHRLQTLTLCLIAVVLAVFAVQPAHALGTQAGTVISNQATVDFTDANGNPLQELSNIVQTTVSQVASVLVDPDNSSTATPGDVVYYAHTVTNTGNGPDTINMTASSSEGWGLVFYLDVDGDGLYNGAVDTLLADSDGDSDPDTGVLADDASVDILIEITIPVAAAEPSVDTTTVTGTSALDGLATETATDTTTISAPTLGVVKSVNPTGDQPPGTTLTYTVVVTNNGSAQANAVVVTDPHRVQPRWRSHLRRVRRCAGDAHSLDRCGSRGGERRVIDRVVPGDHRLGHLKTSPSGAERRRDRRSASSSLPSAVEPTG